MIEQYITQQHCPMSHNNMVNFLQNTVGCHYTVVQYNIDGLVQDCSNSSA